MSHDPEGHVRRAEAAKVTPATEPYAKTPFHPTLDGRPILLGDIIDIADHEEGLDGGKVNLVVCEIRFVRGVPWIHYQEDGKQVNEIICVRNGDLQHARYIAAHRPAGR